MHTRRITAPSHFPPRAAETNAGEVEVRDALQAQADYLSSIGDHAAAVAAYAVAEAKTAGVGPKMDLCFSLIRCAARRQREAGEQSCLWVGGGGGEHARRRERSA